MSSDIPRIHAIFELAMRIGEGQLTNGAAASEVTANVLRILGSSGLRNVVVQVTFDEVALSYLPDDATSPFTRIRSAGARVQDFARLAAYEDITDRYIAGDLNLEEANARAASIPRSKPYYARWLSTLGFALMGGAASLSLGGSVLVVIAATIAAGLLMLTTDVLLRWQVPMFFAQALGGFIGVLAAVVVNFIEPSENSSIVVVACIIVLLAGLASIGAVQDAVTGWYVTASARILETLMLTIGIVVGVRGGLLLLDLIGQEIAITAAVPVSLAQVLLLVVSGAAMGLGFGVGTNVPLRVLAWAAAISALSAVSAYLLTGLLLDRVWAVALTSLVVGVFAALLARWLRAPALLFVMCGIIPMVPGGRIFAGMLSIGSDVDEGIAYLFGAGEIALAIAAGATLGQLVAARLLAKRGAAGWSYTPVVASQFSTPRRRRLTLPRRRKHDPRVVEPSTMTGEMTALPASVQAELYDQLNAPSHAVGTSDSRDTTATDTFAWAARSRHDAPTGEVPTTGRRTTGVPTSDDPATGDDPISDDPTGDDPTGDEPANPRSSHE